MAYNKALPRINSIKGLANLASPFPRTAGFLITAAKKHKLNQSTIDFLVAFPNDEKFENQEDFITRCVELEVLIRDEKKMPTETLRSPQS